MFSHLLTLVTSNVEHSVSTASNQIPVSFRREGTVKKCKTVKIFQPQLYVTENIETRIRSIITFLERMETAI